MLKTYHSQSDITKAYIQMHLSILLWGFSGSLGRSIELTEGILVWYRMIITSASLFLFITVMRTSLRIPMRVFWKLAGIGLVLTIHWLFFYGAIKYSNVSFTLSLFASTTLFTALIEPVITKKKFNKIELLYSLIAMAGIFLIFHSDTNSYTTGLILALISAFVGAFFNILNKKVVHEVRSDVATLYEIFTGLIVLSIFLPVYIHIFHPVTLVPNAHNWVLLFILAITCTQIPLILSLNALKHLPAFTLNLAINLEPVYGITIAFIIFNENKNLGGGFFAGTALIMLSVVLHTYLENRKSNRLMG